MIWVLVLVADSLTDMGRADSATPTSSKWSEFTVTVMHRLRTWRKSLRCKRPNYRYWHSTACA